ncbi:hypothetical protein SISSUDRAFT_12916 [Sistotremastrum suecicum HHB10207 ss-3]|uniref:Uncharacterized protein n=1 Tax=Sistotremastrum suecicum HHB10207 ss-3 TaxID=1314776 RepID=A0A166J5G2_9AGAM|nr:hypothetical protein SISSUDRAFT_12916 [Sistotremastrum suecicum HHB10207 ss-3]
MTITSFPDVSESGDSMALNTHGSQLALMTMTEGHKHMLRMYDLARLDERALFVMELKPFPEGSGDVTAASFSPDDIFIALGRSDDTVEVWDTRYMGPGVKPIFEFSHGPKKRSCPDSFGIASSMQWVQEQRTLGFGLVSGGDDGCVRLWDVRKACLGPQDAEVLAEVDLEVAAFSLGKIGSVGPELVVGDAGGHVHVYEWKREWDE